MIDTKAVAVALGVSEKAVKHAAAVIRETDTAFGVRSGNAWKYRSWEIDRIKAFIAKCAS